MKEMMILKWLPVVCVFLSIRGPRKNPINAKNSFINVNCNIIVFRSTCEQSACRVREFINVIFLNLNVSILIM